MVSPPTLLVLLPMPLIDSSSFSSIVVLHGLASHALGLASDAFHRLLQLLQHLGLTSQLCGDLSIFKKQKTRHGGDGVGCRQVSAVLHVHLQNHQVSTASGGHLLLQYPGDLLATTSPFGAKEAQNRGPLGGCSKLVVKVVTVGNGVNHLGLVKFQIKWTLLRSVIKLMKL